MSGYRPDLDMRTCSVCGEPVAERLKGYIGSLRGCDVHLDEWRESPERAGAMAQSAARGTPIGHAPFEAWAAKKRAMMQAKEEG